MAGDYWVNGYGTSTGGYVPTTTTVTVTPTPAICPDCGRCRTCGQPKPQTIPAPMVPYSSGWWGIVPPATGTGYVGISLAASDALAGEVR